MFLFTVKTTWTYYTEQSFKNAAEEGVCHIVDSTVREEDYVWSNTELGRVFVYPSSQKLKSFQNLTRSISKLSIV